MFVIAAIFIIPIASALLVAKAVAPYVSDGYTIPTVGQDLNVTEAVTL